MLLKVLYEYARSRRLIDEIELTQRTLHLALVLQDDGSVEPLAAWQSFDKEVEGKKGEKKIVLGELRVMPRFPGENNGGKAHFLADLCGPVLGVDAKTGAALSDDPKVGKNPTKAFHHFWRRIEEAHTATRLPALAALLAFRDRYLADSTSRESLPFIAWVPFGKAAKPTLCALNGHEPTPLEGKTITFSFKGLPIFEKGTPLHDFWRDAYRTEAFSAADAGAGQDLGLCMVTGLDNQPIAESHKPEIKGVPGLPPKGGYLVSFAKQAPALASYGFEGTRNAPVSEQAAAGYALALNELLRDPKSRRTVNNQFVICSWLRDDPDLTERINGIIIEPTDDAVQKLFEEFERKGELYRAVSASHFYSMTLASNGGRVVVRRWLDVPLKEVVDHLKSWFHELEVEVVNPPPSRSQYKPPPYRSVAALALATVRTAEDVRPDAYDALYRAALEGIAPEALLAPALHRLRVAAIKSGANIRYQPARFALLRLILNRVTPEEKRTMTIEPQLCETRDEPYNCGRLLAVLDDLQFAAQGDVGADIIARFYGNASTFPRNVYSRLLRLARVHINKLSKEKRAAANALERKINDICALFPCTGPSGAPDFPGLLDVREQGRFALGFYQQKAKDQREKDALRASRQAKVQGQDAHESHPIIEE